MGLLEKNIRFTQTEDQFNNHIILQFDFSDLIDEDELLNFLGYYLRKEFQKLKENKV